MSHEHKCQELRGKKPHLQVEIQDKHPALVT